MNTKQIALPLVVVIAVMLAFSSPAAAEGIGGYAGNHPLTIYDHDTINGGLVFETVTDGSAYTPLQAKSATRDQSQRPSLTQEITISIPPGATVKMARLYNYYCWSTSDFDDPSMFGLPAEADIWFDGEQVTCQNPLSESCPEWYSWASAGPSHLLWNPPIECRDNLPNPINYGNGVIQYWDTKGQNYTSTIWDFPSGVFAWDVTDMVKPILDSSGSGTYTAKIWNHDSTPTAGMPGKPWTVWERFATFGFGLLVVYELPDSPEIEYGIAEGCDYLMSRFGETPENATTSATFGGVGGAIDAALTTVWTHTESGNSEDWDASQNMMYFNGEEIGPSTAVSDQGIGLNYFDVTAKISSDENLLEFQDRNDDSCVHNAFLVVEKPKLAKVIKGEAISDLEAIDTTNEHSQKETDKAIEHINKSLNASLWTDESRLDSKHGKKVFDEEKKAVKHLKKITEGEGEHADPAIVDDVEAVIAKLTEADEQLAVVAINDAKNTPVQDAKKQDKVDKEIAKAEEELTKAAKEVSKDKPDKAIDHYKKAWEHAQQAIKHAQK